MAHVGKFYPVHFRRDLNLRVTNNRGGYARAYDAFANDKGGTVGVALNRKAMHCHAVDEKTFEFAKWTQPFQPIAGFNVRFTIVLTPTQGDVDVGPLLIIEERSLGVLARYETLPSGALGYSVFDFMLIPGSITTPAVYDDPITLRAGCQAIKWEEYHQIYG